MIKEKNIFDKIYKKELNIEFNNLTKTNNKQNAEKDKLNKEVDKDLIKNASDESLDAYLNLMYNSKNLDEVKIPNDFEKEVLKEKVLRNRIKAENIREVFNEIENEILEKVKNKTYVLDISKSNLSRKASNDIFGGNKTQITFEDYLYLLSLKEKIIINEASDILGE